MNDSLRIYGVYTDQEYTNKEELIEKAFGFQVTFNDGTIGYLKSQEQLRVLLGVHSVAEQVKLVQSSQVFPSTKEAFDKIVDEYEKHDAQEATLNRVKHAYDLRYATRIMLSSSDMEVLNKCKQMTDRQVEGLEIARVRTASQEAGAKIQSSSLDAELGVKNLAVPVKEDGSVDLDPIARASKKVNKEGSKKHLSFGKRTKLAIGSVAMAAVILATNLLSSCGVMKNNDKAIDDVNPSISQSTTIESELTAEQAVWLARKDAMCIQSDEQVLRLPNELKDLEGNVVNISSIRSDLALSGREYTALYLNYSGDRDMSYAGIAFDSYAEMNQYLNSAIRKLTIAAPYMTVEDIHFFDNLFVNTHDQEKVQELQSHIVNGVTDPKVIMGTINDLYNSPNNDMKAFVSTYAITYYAALGVLNETVLNEYGFTGVQKDLNEKLFNEKVEAGLIPVFQIEERYCGDIQGAITALAEAKRALGDNDSLFVQEDDKLNEKHNHVMMKYMSQSLNRVVEVVYLAKQEELGLGRGLFGNGPDSLGGAYTFQEAVYEEWTERVSGRGDILTEESEANRQAAIDEIKDKINKGLLPGIDPSTVGQVSGNEGETTEERREEGQTVVTNPDLKDKTDGPDYTIDENGNYKPIPGTGSTAKPTGNGDKTNGLIDELEKEAGNGQTPTPSPDPTPDPTPAPAPDPTPAPAPDPTPAPAPDPTPDPAPAPAPDPNPDPNPNPNPDLSGGGITDVTEGEFVPTSPVDRATGGEQDSDTSSITAAAVEAAVEAMVGQGEVEINSGKTM